MSVRHNFSARLVTDDITVNKQVNTTTEFNSPFAFLALTISPTLNPLPVRNKLVRNKRFGKVVGILLCSVTVDYFNIPILDMLPEEMPPAVVMPSAGCQALFCGKS